VQNKAESATKQLWDDLEADCSEFSLAREHEGTRTATDMLSPVVVRLVVGCTFLKATAAHMSDTLVSGALNFSDVINFVCTLVDELPEFCQLEPLASCAECGISSGDLKVCPPPSPPSPSPIPTAQCACSCCAY